MMNIIEREDDDVLILSATGRIDSSTAAVLEAILPKRVRDHAITIVDLENVPYLSSAGLRVLLIGAKTAKASGNILIVSGASQAVREVFDISGFSQILRIADDIPKAIAAIAQHR